MILIQTEAKLKNALRMVDKTIMKGAEKGAENLVEQMVLSSRNFLTSAIAATGGKESGNLSSSINKKPGSTGTPNLIRWDLVVDTNKAPYAEWIEAGNKATALPYSTNGKKDYSTSRFQGHKYLLDTYNMYSDSDIAIKIVAEGIVSELLKLENK